MFSRQFVFAGIFLIILASGGAYFSFYNNQIEDSKGLFADLVSAVAGQETNLKLVAEIPLYNKNKENISGAADNRINAIDNDINSLNTQNVNLADIQDEDLIEQQAKLKKEEEQGGQETTAQAGIAAPNNQITSNQPVIFNPAQVCAFNTDKNPNHQSLIINEVAWMGGSASANDEWLELKNISVSELDIGGWQLLDKDEQIKITFGAKKLPVNGFMLLERTDDNSIPGIAADFIYTGALSNVDEGLRLFDNECNLLDEVLAAPDWPAGESADRKTMERASDLSWHTSADIMGTPKKENSPLAVSQPVEALADNSQPLANSAGQLDHIVISEIQITGGSGHTTDDFIELYNPTSAAINLNGYRLVKRTKTGTSDTNIKSWTSDANIPAKGFYLWANSSYAGIAAIPDESTAASLADDNGVALRQGGADTGIIIDSVAWGEAQNDFVEGSAFSNNPAANQSIGRSRLNDTGNNQNDFEIRSLPNPQNSQSLEL